MRRVRFEGVANQSHRWVRQIPESPGEPARPLANAYVLTNASHHRPFRGRALRGPISDLRSIGGLKCKNHLAGYAEGRQCPAPQTFVTVPSTRFHSRRPFLPQAGRVFYVMCFHRAVAATFAILAVSTGLCRAGDDEAVSLDDLPRIIESLGADDFAARNRAAEQLAELASRTDLDTALAERIQRTLYQADLRYEARRQLELWAKKLPAVAIEPPGDVPPGELDRLILAIDANDYGRRVGAAARLSWLVGRPEVACQVITRLRPRLRERTLSIDARRRIEPIWQDARRVWLASDPAHWRLPPVANDEIHRRLDALVRPLPPLAEAASAGQSDDLHPRSEKDIANPRARLERKRRLADREMAETDLLDLLVRDDLTGAVLAAIEERLAAGRIDDDARHRLAQLALWTRPAVALEHWQDKQLASVDRLLLGVPLEASPERAQVVGKLAAERPTLFDRADGQTAHCANSDILPKGNYPVGVFFPHPNPIGSGMFILQSLATPRQRLAYEYVVKVPAEQRLAEHSQRTLDRLLAQRRALKQAELIMLELLDEGAVSRFAAKYVQAVGDPPPPDRERENKAGRGSPYVNLCSLLAEIGTQEAAPGMVAAIRSGKLPRATDASPDDWPWMATLAILARDPGPHGERLLAGMIANEQRLRLASDHPSDVGATAAAILLALHDVPPERFGLESAGDPFLAEFGGPGYRFTTPDGRQKVLDWWAKVKGE